MVLVARAHRLHVGQHHDEIAREPGMQGGDVGDRARVGDAAGLHQDVLGRPVAVDQAIECVHEIVAHGAAHAAVRERDGLPVVVGDEAHRRPRARRSR